MTAALLCAVIAAGLLLIAVLLMVRAAGAEGAGYVDTSRGRGTGD